MISPQQRRDKLVRATDLDALSCRYNANQRGYFSVPDKYIPELIQSYQKYLPFCHGYTNLSAGRTLKAAFQEPKLPLINRGTYFRTKSIDIVVQEFISQHTRDGAKCQVISLGSGSDTRGFRVLEQHPGGSVIYHEVDFPESSRIKRAAIASNPEIQKIVGASIAAGAAATVPPSREAFEALESDLHTDNYHLYGFDLREIETPANPLTTHVDTSIPTIIISECVLCYLTFEENVRILKHWSERFSASHTTAAFLIYEPMSLNDAFGKTMVANLSGRGITMPNFEKFPDLESRRTFFNELGFSSVRVTDLSEISGYESKIPPWITDAELQRINSLELIDEIEEIRLLLKHYCLVFAGIGHDLESALNW